MELGFGWWDHFERQKDVSLEQQYANRIEMVQLAEKLGFTGYHVAEHHFSDLDLAPSPLVYLSALSQRTTSIRLGAMVLCLPLYHPTRLLQELCMVDQLTGGRLDPGVGRGIRDVDHVWLGSDPMDTRARYAETLEILEQGLNSGNLQHDGKYFSYDNVEVRFDAIQKPLRFWYAGNPESAAKNAMNVVGFGFDDDLDRYWELFAEGLASGDPRFAGPLPRAGSTRHIFIAESDDEAKEVAARAWKIYGDNFWSTTVCVEGNLIPKGAIQGFGGDHDSEEMMASGVLVAGSPETVTERLLATLEAAGPSYNYLVNAFQWGDITHSEAKSSMSLFATKIMPTLKSAHKTRDSL